MNKKFSILTVALLALSLMVWKWQSGQSVDEDIQEKSTGSRLAELLGSEAAEGYLLADKARTFDFPQDHGPHPGFRNEWWYLTGNLDSEEGRPFGYELTIFRFSLVPGLEKSFPSEESAWRTGQVFIAHLAVTDVEEGQFLVKQRYARGALGLAGAQADPFRVWVEDWSIATSPANQTTQSNGTEVNWSLSVAVDEIALDLNLKSVKPAVLNGVDGLSRKSEGKGNASYYYSITRLASEGSLRIGDQQFSVSGQSWLDREWSSSALSPDQAGWDWFALQLSDGSDLMFYNLRLNDGSQDVHSAGTWTDAAGVAQHLHREDVIMVVTNQWRNPMGDSYPAGWTITIESLGLDIVVTPLMPDQELVTTVRYWEGAVGITGTRNGVSINGRGYVELTGYSE